QSRREEVGGGPRLVLPLHYSVLVALLHPLTVLTSEEANMKGLLTIGMVMAGVLTLVSVGAAGVRSGEVGCGGVHAVRSNPSIGLSEMFYTSIAVRNHNTLESVTIQRITIRDAFGATVFDGGPATSTPFPPNRDFSISGEPLDITVVPPSTTHYLATKDIWGDSPIPSGNQNGNSLTINLQFSTLGKSDLVFVSVSNIVRQLVSPGVPRGIEGEETHAGSIGVHLLVVAARAAVGQQHRHSQVKKGQQSSRHRPYLASAQCSSPGFSIWTKFSFPRVSECTT